MRTDMKTINNIKIFSALLAAIAAVSCEGTDETRPAGHERVSFELSGSVPIVSYPEDNVRYDFTVSCASGLGSIGTWLDGKLIDGSLAEYPESPVRANYSFSYAFTPEQVGQTVDFVFTAECADGYRAYVDYPVYVRSISETVNVVLPEGLANEAVVGDALKFDVTVSTGYPLAKIRTLKDGAELPELTKTSGFREAKADIYQFIYILPKSDGGSEVTFTFEGTDSKGNFGVAEYKLTVRKGQPKALYSEIFDTPMRISNTTEFDTSAGGITGQSASEFVPGTIARYSGNDPDVTEGVKTGLTVLDNDRTTVSYSSDGAEICLSKYNYSAMKHISGTYVWARKGKKGWLGVSGIKLHGCTSLTLSYLQCGGSVKVEWSADGAAWNEVCTSTKTDEVRADFSVPESTESISLRFTENAGGAHLRFDNISLKGE